VDGHPIVLVCDSYEPGGGYIMTSGVAGVAGANGAPGAKGPGVGKAGQDGKPGTDGTSAWPITLIARSAQKVLLRADGGRAGDGGNGGEGGDGMDVVELRADGHPQTLHFDGGKGGDGAAAGKAGNAASITFKHSSTAFTGAGGGVSVTALTATGGAHGIGGTGGVGGLSGKSGKKRAPSGKTGASTPVGVAGTITNVHLSSADWNAAAVAALPAAAVQQWADYRERVGEYEFRSYIESDPATKGRRLMAKAEFGAVLALRPNSPRAQRFSDHLKLGLTPIGFPYDHDLRPKFEIFEQFMVDYSGHRDWLFGQLASFLQSVANASQGKTVLRNQTDFHTDLGQAAQTELQIAVDDEEEAAQRLDYAIGQVKALADKLAKLDEARLNAGMSLTDYIGIIGEVVAAVAGVAAAAISGGTSLVGTIAAVGALADTAGGLFTDAEALQKAGSLFDGDDITDMKLRPEATKLFGSLGEAATKVKKIVESTKQFITAAEAIYDLINAEVDPSDAPEPQVMAAQIQASFDVAMGQLGVQRSILAKVAAQQKLTAYQNAKVAADDLLWSTDKQIATLTKIARMLVIQFQVYNDLIMLYSFYANRAFDLYTLPANPLTPATRFNFGYVHPDIEANAYGALARAAVDPGYQATATQRITDLMGRYVESLQGLDPGTVRNRYIDYTLTELDSVTTQWNITSPSVINALRTHGVASFQTSFDEIDDEYGKIAELKIQQIAMAIVGAHLKPPNQNQTFCDVYITHPGTASNRRHDVNTVIPISAPALTDHHNATFAPIDLEHLDSAGDDLSEAPRSWGRSPVTTWHIKISSQTAEKLDLSGLSELQFAVKYAHWVPKQSAKTKPTPGSRQAIVSVTGSRP
jgi:hypothetical protein